MRGDVPALDPLAYPDTYDRRQATRSGADWPAHKARARNRRSRRLRKDTRP